MKMDNCIFCKIVSGEIKSWKVYEDEHTFAFFDVNPINEYHTVVVPKKHYTDMFDIPEDEAILIMKAIKKIACLFNDKLDMKNIQILNNSGEEAQQSVFHIHFHIIPRFSGDGQNIKWTDKLELRERFDEFIEKLC